MKAGFERQFAVGFFCLILLWQCAGLYSQSILSEQYHQAIQGSLRGQWVCTIGKTKVKLTLSEDGHFVLNDRAGTYTITDNNLNLKTDSTETSYQFELSADGLKLKGPELKEELTFTRMRGIEEAKDWFSGISAKSVNATLLRILFIIGVIVIIRSALSGLKRIVQFVIYTNLGPFKYLYRHHKKRTMTLYSLVLNILKYIIYFAGLGFVLTELGVDYRAYLASLSVIGLAIGFGSQGLVQDMVTGFFIMFEDQFNVGDMVEIPPYVGIVEDIGLRMTRLTNYTGQKVTIPNRNIAAVGTFTKGVQQVYIDVAVDSYESGEKVRPMFEKASEEIGKQFSGIILSRPGVLKTVTLGTGEHFVRLYCGIWPQQEWVVEQQLVPRIRKVLKDKGIKIPEERIIVSYHPREEIPVARWGYPKKETGG